MTSSWITTSWLQIITTSWTQMTTDWITTYWLQMTTSCLPTNYMQVEYKWLQIGWLPDHYKLNTNTKLTTNSLTTNDHRSLQIEYKYQIDYRFIDYKLTTDHYKLDTDSLTTNWLQITTSWICRWQITTNWLQITTNWIQIPNWLQIHWLQNDHRSLQIEYKYQIDYKFIDYKLTTDHYKLNMQMTDHYKLNTDSLTTNDKLNIQMTTNCIQIPNWLQIHWLQKHYKSLPSWIYRWPQIEYKYQIDYKFIDYKNTTNHYKLTCNRLNADDYNSPQVEWITTNWQQELFIHYHSLS
jgi:DNA-dependent RNA polymerase auxiliary subunit epsilon